MEFVLIFVAVCFAYGLGRKHGRKAVQRKVRGSFDWLQ
jgi:hypothetical protein